MSGSINRYFFEIKPTEIQVRESPVKTLEIGTGSGIKTFHCCRIGLNGKVQFRKYLCACDHCITNEFVGNCNQISYCGRWLDAKPFKFKSKSKSKLVITANATEASKPQKPRPVVVKVIGRVSGNKRKKPTPKYSANKRGRLDHKLPQLEPTNAALPPNWRKYYNNDGRPYYHNIITKETTWRYPNK